MRFNLKITLLRPLLGSLADDDNESDICKFDRDSFGRIVIHQENWYGIIKATLEALKLDRKPELIRMTPWFEAPVSLYRRTYNKIQFRMHESVPAKSVILLTGTADKMDTEDGASRVESFSLGELEKIFEHLGGTYGISPWGKKWGYGTFTVTELSEAGTVSDK